MIVFMREISLHLFRNISTNQENVDSYTCFILLIYSSSSMNYNIVIETNTLYIMNTNKTQNLLLKAESVIVMQIIRNYIEVTITI